MKNPLQRGENLFQKIFPYCDDISCSHGDEKVAGLAVAPLKNVSISANVGR